MARGNRGTTTTTNGDGALGSAEPSASPPAATSPARSSKLGNSKKRKRGDNLKSPKRSKFKSQEGQQDHSAGEESDDDEDYKRPLANVKLEEEDETMAGDPLDAPGPSLDSSEAERILLVLERLDASNALDTVHTIRGTATSLRQNFLNPSSVTLRALRDRVRQQAPSTMLDLHRHRRAPTSRTTPKIDYGLVRFYQIAQELLDDAASAHASAAYIDMPSTSVVRETSEALPLASTSKANSLSGPAYALHQYLPTGDYFTSAASMTRVDLQSLPKGQASFLEIHPTPALPPQAFPTLGTYAVSSTPQASSLSKRTPLSQQRTSTAPKPSHAPTLSSAAFIDYGIFSSLAPAFDSDGGQVGRDVLALVSTFKRERAQRRSEARTEAQKALRELAAKKLSMASQDESAETFGESITARLGRLDLKLSPANSESRDALASMAASLLGNDEEALNGALRALDQCSLEDELNALLGRHSRALRRLQCLQAVRFRAGTKGKEVALVEGSEEWHLGRELLASLTATVGLRPRVRSLSPASSAVSLTPRRSALHCLQRSAPRDPTPGYRGTLSSTRDFALIDNTTIRLSPGAALLPPPPVAKPSATATPSTGPTLPPAPSLASASGQYGYTTRPGTASYGYAGRGAAASGSGTSTPRAPATNPNAQYYPSSAYQYSQQPTPSMNGGYYATSSSIAGSSPYTPTRAVPNLGGKPVTMGANSAQWSTTGGTGGILGGVALPPHLRTTRPAPSPYAPTLYSSATPGTPIGAGMVGVAKPNGTPPSWAPITSMR